MQPFPWDYLAGWEKQHGISLPKEARMDLIETFEHLDQLERERMAAFKEKHGISD